MSATRSMMCREADDQIKPFRMNVRLRNNRLIVLREQLGQSQAECARVSGVSQGSLNALETLRISPLRPDGEWSSPAKRIAEFHGVSPEWIWPEEVKRLRARAIMLETNAAELVASPTGSRRLEAEASAAMVQEWTKKLTPREARAVTATVVEEKGFAELASEFGVSGGMVAIIQRRGLQKMREASRADVRKGNVDGLEPPRPPEPYVPESYVSAPTPAASAPARRARSVAIREIDREDGGFEYIVVAAGLHGEWWIVATCPTLELAREAWATSRSSLLST
jgi:transcriptional regulator with XRE-family HTH domain